jgi:hypothetical protein
MTSALPDITNTQYLSAFFSVAEYIKHARLLTGFSPPP